jgi:hypothetical protein
MGFPQDDDDDDDDNEDDGAEVGLGYDDEEDFDEEGDEEAAGQQEDFDDEVTLPNSRLPTTHTHNTLLVCCEHSRSRSLGKIA